MKPAHPSSDAPSGGRWATVTVHAIVVAAILVTLWDFLDGHPTMELVLLEAPLWLVAIASWLVWLVATAVRRRGRIGTRNLAAWSIVPVLLAVTVAIVGTGVLVDVRFRLSEPRLSEAADGLSAGTWQEGPTTVGLFQVADAWADGGGAYFRIGSVGFLDAVTIARDVGEDVCRSKRPLAPRWSLCYIVY